MAELLIGGALAVVIYLLVDRHMRREDARIEKMMRKDSFWTRRKRDEPPKED